jgi:hypothetical protein
MLSFDLIGKMEEDDIPDLLFTLDLKNLFTLDFEKIVWCSGMVFSV